MKHFKVKMCIFAVIVVATLFACNGNGKTPKPDSNNQNSGNPSTPSVKGEDVVIKFDSTKMKVFMLANAASPIYSGKEVKVGTKLQCVAEDNAVGEDEVFDGFLFNKKKVDNGLYKVEAGDAQQEGSKNIINIVLAKRKKTSEKVKVVFASNIKAKIIREEGNISTGELVEDGTTLIFTATVSKGKVLETWLVNGEKKDPSPENRKELPYIVNASKAKKEGDTKVIEVTFTEKVAKTVYLQFDDSFIKQLYNVDDSIEITQNKDVKVGTLIRITIADEKITDGKLVDSFLVNDQKTPSITQRGPGEYQYIVDEKDAKTEGDKLIIKIALKLRDKIKIKLKFDDNGIEAISTTRQPDGTEKVSNWKNGDIIDENLFIYFSLKDADKIAEKWLLNGEKCATLGPPETELRQMFLIATKDIAKQEGSEYVMHIQVVLKQAEQITINFEPPIICYSFSAGQNTEVLSGTPIKEGTYLNFHATLPNGKIGENWLVNDTKKDNFQKDTEFRYTVKASDAKNNIIEVKLSTHDSKTVTLVLEKDGVDAVRSIPNNSPEKLTNGSEVKEGDSLNFTLKTTDKIVEKWFINGKAYYPGEKYGNSLHIGDTGDYMDIHLEDKYIVADENKNVIKVSYEVRELQNIKIEFDSNKLTCKDPYNNTVINSGIQVKEKTSLKFESKDGVFVKNWVVSGKKIREYLLYDDEYMHLNALKRHAVTEGSDLVIKVEVTERKPFDFTIKFNPNKVSCKNENKTVATESKVKEGTELTFGAIGAQEQAELIWEFGRTRERGNATKKHNLSVSDLRGYNNFIIKVDWVEE